MFLTWFCVFPQPESGKSVVQAEDAIWAEVQLVTSWYLVTPARAGVRVAAWALGARNRPLASAAIVAPHPYRFKAVGRGSRGGPPGTTASRPAPTASRAPRLRDEGCRCAPPS